MRPRVVMLTCLAVSVVVASALLLVPATRVQLEALTTHGKAAAANPGQSPAAKARMIAQAPPPLPILSAPGNPASVTSGSSHTIFFGWAFLDRTTKKITGSANSVTSPNTTESMVKAWIASDYLRTHPSPSDAVLNELHLMIINSNDNIAQKYYKVGGGNADMTRMIKTCGLTHTTIKSGWWAETAMPPQDAVKYGECVADGTAAGKKWTSWVLDQMRHVQGTVAQNNPKDVEVQGGHWGIIDGLPANLVATTSIKNGWTDYGGSWHVNCLAINPAWVLAVEMRTNTDSLQTAADVCAHVAGQLTVTPEI
ncbi:hypothetical protein [Rugosimonospora africana]|uniref:Uncharacterized protein n=1 Tax=Rugosimonospora africana TaxID=556532 RepID=A0A8J3QLX2_9ACTN|nr:hypothetical protein [Rugosimonospora africana]GIH13440.1 hypothetical protein Raf01_16120 [Rugosimonospora africana]